MEEYAAQNIEGQPVICGKQPNGLEQNVNNYSNVLDQILSGDAEGTWILADRFKEISKYAGSGDLSFEEYSRVKEFISTYDRKLKARKNGKEKIEELNRLKENVDKKYAHYEEDYLAKKPLDNSELEDTKFGKIILGEDENFKLGSRFENLERYILNNKLTEKENITVDHFISKYEKIVCRDAKERYALDLLNPARRAVKIIRESPINKMSFEEYLEVKEYISAYEKKLNRTIRSVKERCELKVFKLNMEREYPQYEERYLAQKPLEKSQLDKSKTELEKIIRGEGENFKLGPRFEKLREYLLNNELTEEEQIEIDSLISAYGVLLNSNTKEGKVLDSLNWAFLTKQDQEEAGCNPDFFSIYNKMGLADAEIESIDFMGDEAELILGRTIYKNLPFDWIKQNGNENKDKENIDMGPMPEMCSAKNLPPFVKDIFGIEKEINQITIENEGDISPLITREESRPIRALIPERCLSSLESLTVRPSDRSVERFENKNVAYEKIYTPLERIWHFISSQYKSRKEAIKFLDDQTKGTIDDILLGKNYFLLPIKVESMITYSDLPPADRYYDARGWSMERSEKEKPLNELIREHRLC